MERPSQVVINEEEEFEGSSNDDNERVPEVVSPDVISFVEPPVPIVSQSDLFTDRGDKNWKYVDQLLTTARESLPTDVKLDWFQHMNKYFIVKNYQKVTFSKAAIPPRAKTVLPEESAQMDNEFKSYSAMIDLLNVLVVFWGIKPSSVFLKHRSSLHLESVKIIRSRVFLDPNVVITHEDIWFISSMSPVLLFHSNFKRPRLELVKRWEKVISSLIMTVSNPEITAMSLKPHLTDIIGLGKIGKLRRTMKGRLGKFMVPMLDFEEKVLYECCRLTLFELPRKKKRKEKIEVSRQELTVLQSEVGDSMDRKQAKRKLKVKINVD